MTLSLTKGRPIDHFGFSEVPFDKNLGYEISDADASNKFVKGCTWCIAHLIRGLLKKSGAPVTVMGHLSYVIAKTKRASFGRNLARRFTLLRREDEIENVESIIAGGYVGPLNEGFPPDPEYMQVYCDMVHVIDQTVQDVLFADTKIIHPPKIVFTDTNLYCYAKSGVLFVDEAEQPGSTLPASFMACETQAVVNALKEHLFSLHAQKSTMHP